MVLKYINTKTEQSTLRLVCSTVHVSIMPISLYASLNKGVISESCRSWVELYVIFFLSKRSQNIKSTIIRSGRKGKGSQLRYCTARSLSSSISRKIKMHTGTRGSLPSEEQPQFSRALGFWQFARSHTHLTVSLLAWSSTVICQGSMPLCQHFYSTAFVHF